MWLPVCVLTKENFVTLRGWILSFVIFFGFIWQLFIWVTVTLYTLIWERRRQWHFNSTMTVELIAFNYLTDPLSLQNSHNSALKQYPLVTWLFSGHVYIYGLINFINSSIDPLLFYLITIFLNRLFIISLLDLGAQWSCLFWGGGVCLCVGGGGVVIVFWAYISVSYHHPTPKSPSTHSPILSSLLFFPSTGPITRSLFVFISGVTRAKVDNPFNKQTAVKSPPDSCHLLSSSS